MPLTAEQAERWGLVNHLVDESELLKKAREVAEAILKNNQDLVLRYKSVINDGLKLDLGHALILEKVVSIFMQSCLRLNYNLLGVSWLSILIKSHDLV